MVAGSEFPESCWCLGHRGSTSTPLTLRSICEKLQKAAINSFIDHVVNMGSLSPRLIFRVPVGFSIQTHQAVVDNTRNRTQQCRSPQAPRRVGVAHHTTHTSQYAGRTASRQSLARLHGAHEVLPALLSYAVKVLSDGSRYDIAFVSACNLLQLVRYIPLKCKSASGIR
jgi:hypothetical protein